MAGKRVADAGLTDRVAIRVQDYRDVDDGPFDAISSIGMSEHVGREQMPAYVATAARAAPPGRPAAQPRHFLERRAHRAGPGLVHPALRFPDGEMLSLAEMVGALEAGGLEVLDVEALRRHYALTLRAWVRRLEANWDEAVRLTT